MNSPILLIGVALAIIFLSEGKYLLVSVEEPDVLLPQSRNGFKCNPQPSIPNGNGNGLKDLLKDLFSKYETNKPKIITCAYAVAVVTEPLNGNYIAYEVIPNKAGDPLKDGNLHIVSMADNKCDPSPEPCRCENMFNSLFNHPQEEEGSNRKVKDSVKKLTIQAQEVTTTSFQYRCTCLLGSAKKAGFVSVKMDTAGISTICRDPQRLDGKSVQEVCGVYTSNQCYDSRIILEKKYTGRK